MFRPIRALVTTMLLGIVLRGDPARAERPMNFLRSEKADRIAATVVLHLRLDTTYTFETRNLSRGSDTVLVILDDERPLDWNDDRPRRPTDRAHPAASFLKFTPRRRRIYSIQVRARDGSLEGTCDLYQDNKLLLKNAPFGARYRAPRPTSMPFPRPERPVQNPEVDVYELEKPWPSFRAR